MTIIFIEESRIIIHVFIHFYWLVRSYFSKKKNSNNYYKNIGIFETFRTVAWSIDKLRPLTT